MNKDKKVGQDNEQSSAMSATKSQQLKPNMSQFPNVPKTQNKFPHGKATNNKNYGNAR